jgi:hypothetical protein
MSAKATKYTVVALVIIILGAFVRQSLYLNDEPQETLQQSERGAELAATFCSSCHLEPAPDILPKRSWNVALAYMGYFLGMEDTSYLDTTPQFVRDYVAATHGYMAQDGVLPGAPLLAERDWLALRSYYIDSAPASSLPQVGKPELRWQLPQFRIVESDYQSRPAVTTLVRINAEAQEAVVGDSGMRSLAVLGVDGQLKGRPRKFGPAMLPVDIEFRPGMTLVASIGDLYSVSASEDRPGLIVRIAPNLTDESDSRTTVELDGLYRTADMELADLNGDNVDDFIISGFGGSYGSLAWFESQPDGSYVAHTLMNRPGAVRAQVHDFNNDGFLDIAVLMAHAREGFYVLINDGSNEFDTVTIFETHPGYGHTYFELQDFNRDGRIDVMTVNGDNADSDPYNTSSNYHGVRVYLNEGDLQFQLAYFYPMYGAFGVRAADFDNDGDLDIAAISFYPDFASDTRESFVYLQNRGDLSFDAFTSDELNRGRWMTLDAGDLDGDDDIDIILGAGYLPTGMLAYPGELQKLSENGPSILLLQNVGSAEATLLHN